MVGAFIDAGRGLSAISGDGDTQISLEDAHALLKKLDTNGDGFLDHEEIMQAFAGALAAGGGKDDSTAWRAPLKVHDGTGASGKWTTEAWANSLPLGAIVAKAIAPPPGQDAFQHAKTVLAGKLEARLKEARLEGLYPILQKEVHNAHRGPVV